MSVIITGVTLSKNIVKTGGNNESNKKDNNIYFIAHFNYKK